MIAMCCGVVPLLGAGLLMLAPWRGRAADTPEMRRATDRLHANLPRAVLLGVSFSTALTALTAAITRSGPEHLLWNYFVVDATSILFLNLISIVFFGVAMYVWYRLSTGLLPQGQGQGGFVVRVLLFYATCVFAVLSNHLLAMWAFLELGTLAIAPLIYFGRGASALRASWKYLLFSVVGLGFNLAGLMCLARAASGAHGQAGTSFESAAGHCSFFLNDLANLATTTGEPLWWKLGLALMILGLGTKLGLAPMYAWLPDAYDEAPPSVTALLSAVQFNCVLLALFRQVGLLRFVEPTLVSSELIVLGTLSIAVATLQIVKADNYKRLIAYASINHAGTIAVGLGLGKNAGYGVVVYVVSNALVKAVLFLSCGNIKARFGTKQISALRGIIRVMPFTGWAFMLGVFALLGFAPFGSFLGEVIMLSNMVEGVLLPVFFFICIMLTIVLVAAGRSLFPMIWGDSADEGPRVREPLLSNAAGLFFIVILVSLGIYTPAPLSALLLEVAATLGGG